MIYEDLNASLGTRLCSQAHKSIYPHDAQNCIRHFFGFLVILATILDGNYFHSSRHHHPRLLWNHLSKKEIIKYN